MDYLLFLLIIFGVIVLIMLLQYRNSKKSDKLFLLNLEKKFGCNDRSSYDHKRLAGVKGYYMRHAADGALDDITWSDLEMNELFAYTDTTQSDIGCEVLYHRLRTPLTDPESINSRRRAIAYWIENPELRNQILIKLHHMKWMNRSSVYDHMDELSALKKKNTAGYAVMIAVLILTVVSMYFIGGFGVLLFIASLTFNLVTYYRDRTAIEQYFRTFEHIIDLTDVSGEIYRELDKSGETDQARAFMGALGKLRGFRRRNGILPRMSGTGNPFMVLFDIIGAVFFVRLFRFWSMKDALVRNMDAVDELITLTGGIDADISMASFVSSLKAGRCEAVFTEAYSGGLHNVAVENLYHPLLDDPVCNSIDLKKSILLTGANASGKSTFLKALAISVIMAQTTGYVCASKYSAPILRCMSSMSLRDDISGGDSYYMAEIKSVKRILDAASATGNETYGIICFVDELLRGTNTVERIAASTQILKKLDESGAIVCAATHDLELTALLTGFEDHHFEEDLSEGDVHFSYRLKPGAARGRNAISLLGTLGYGDDITDAAMQMVRNYESTGLWTLDED